MTVRPFTPSRDSPADLAARTVGREDLLASIERRLDSAARTGNRPHTLLVGPRGSGKTHVIEVVLHRLVGEGFVVARLDEDAVGVASYTDLLAELARSAGVDAPAGAGRDAAALEAALVAHLDGRVLLAVIENLARVFAAMGTGGQRDLRSFVETAGAVVLLASTPQLFAGIGSRNEPWFGSFAVERLDPLTPAQCVDLLGHVAGAGVVRFVRSRGGRARVAALHHLVGGWPRVWMVVAGHATPEALDELVPAVEQLVEQFVPSFQQRLWTLPPNEARLVRALGTGSPAATVAELAAAAGLTERTAATALGRLADGGWVRGEKRAGADQRRTWYRLREPLLRLHFLYRGGGALRETVDYVRAWFDPLLPLPPPPTPPPPAEPEAAIEALTGRSRPSLMS